MSSGGHMMDFIKRMRFNRSQLKHRKKFKSGEKIFNSVEVSQALKGLELKDFKHLTDEEFLEYKRKLHARLARERKLFLLKMLLGILVLGSLVYWLFTAIFL